MLRKPSPELETLKELAKRASDRLEGSLHRLQRKLHVPEDTPEEDTGENQRPTEHD